MLLLLLLLLVAGPPSLPQTHQRIKDGGFIVIVGILFIHNIKNRLPKSKMSIKGKNKNGIPINLNAKNRIC